MSGLDDIAVVQLHRLTRFVLGEHRLVELFAGADADDLDLAVRRHGTGEIHHVHARQLGYEDFAAVHPLDARDHKAHALLESDPEAGHPLVRNCHFAVLPLLPKERNNAAATADHVAVAHTTETRPL